MTLLTNRVAEQLQRVRRGDPGDAFFNLLEMEHDVLPELMAAFRAESDRDVRAFIVNVIWEHRQPSVISFLGEALRDPEQIVRQEALDGLAALASPEALDVLTSAREQASDGEFRGWLDEAIEQARAQHK
jgi:HEAT repeat protein